MNRQPVWRYVLGTAATAFAYYKTRDPWWAFAAGLTFGFTIDSVLINHALNEASGDYDQEVRP